MTDVHMLGKSGYQLISEVQQITPKQKFVIITGTPQDEYINDARACFYLEKPVSVDKMIAVITLLTSCTIAGDQNLAAECKLLSDLHSFNITDWKCPHIK